jgi:hypothetical protein
MDIECSAHRVHLNGRTTCASPAGRRYQHPQYTSASATVSLSACRYLVLGNRAPELGLPCGAWDSFPLRKLLTSLPTRYLGSSGPFPPYPMALHTVPAAPPSAYSEKSLPGLYPLDPYHSTARNFPSDAPHAPHAYTCPSTSPPQLFMAPCASPDPLSGSPPGATFSSGSCPIRACVSGSHFCH